ncbi:hypothetical protein M0D21_08665 [Aquimarina sp. D1M17]|uniref:hypothetical protein n=1 Tax=Aquimarina acroporae TaxID=2937283 RepID=UPI0020BE9310|nr:hypothetical protein [Aquimarina acroporae]MCK8521639.1 hypothetical protein [Aquimarina acroporae]
MKIIRLIKKLLNPIKKFGSNIEWRSKIVDLFIVIIGITLAFRLNAWSESKKQDDLLSTYLTSFDNENASNIMSLNEVLAASHEQLAKVDTLQHIMRIGNYADQRLSRWSPSLLNAINYKPTLITLESIKESGDFELIKNYELKRKIITAYESLVHLKEQELVLNDYVKNITRPYFFEKIRYRDFYPVDDEGLIRDHRFENIIIGYGLIMRNQIQGYDSVMVNLLNLKDELSGYTNK